MTYDQRRRHIRRDNRINLWLDVFAAAAFVLLAVAAGSGAILLIWS